MDTGIAKIFLEATHYLCKKNFELLTQKIFMILFLNI